MLSVSKSGTKSVGRDVAERLGLEDRQPVDRRQPADHVVVDDGGRGRGTGRDAHQVGVGEAVVERRERGAGARRGEQRDGHGQRVQPELHGPLPRQRAGERVGPLAQLGVGDGAVGSGDGPAIAQRVGRHVEDQ